MPHNPHIARFFTLSSFVTTLRRGIALTLITALLVLSVPPSGVRAAAGDAMQGSSGLLASIWTALASLTSARKAQGSGMPGGDAPAPERIAPQPPPTKEELKVKVARIEVNPQGDITLAAKQPLILAAVPVDHDGNPIQGLGVEWVSSDKQVVFITRDGQAVGGKPGKTELTASVANKQEKVRVTVTAEGAPFGGKKQDSVRQEDKTNENKITRGGGTRNTTRTVRATWSPDVKPRASMFKRAFYEPNKRSASLTPVVYDPNTEIDDPLPDAETPSLYSPVNEVGTPPGRTEPGAGVPATATGGTETPGSSNFNFGVPLLDLPGRGIGVSLALSYNSRLWHKSTSSGITHLTFDVDSGWPAPGFRLGYGFIEAQGSQGFTLVDPNGTRRELRKLNTNPNDHNYETTDGSFIHFYGGRGWGTVTYTSGIRVEYGAAGTGFRNYPVKITDANGNYTLINYAGANGVGPRINTITDTLSRYVKFYYDAGNDLVTITAPGYEGGAERQAVRFYYESRTPSTSFQVAATSPGSIRMIRYIYFPGTQSGYRYDYSDYGMIRQIAQLRKMTVTTDSITATGSVTSDGRTAATTTYDYPEVASNLPDAPKYTKRTDEWAGRTTGMAGTGAPGAAPYYEFNASEADGTSSVTAPDGTVTTTDTYTETEAGSDAWKTGLVESTVLKDGTTELRRTTMTWESDTNGRNARLQKVEAKDETGKTTSTVFGYTSYNNINLVKELGFNNEELRRTETTYETGAAWTDRRLVRLPTSVRVYAGGATTPAARTDYEYDNYGVDAVGKTKLTARADIQTMMHDSSYNPHAPLVETCQWESDPNDPDCQDMGCLQYNPSCDGNCTQIYQCHTSSPYVSVTDKRGNVTKVTRYANAANATEAVTSTMTYDVAGNLVTTSADCCQQQAFDYSVGYNYAYPTSVVKGNGATQLTTSTTFDAKTGLVRTTTDENNQVTTIHYYPLSLRHLETVSPDGSKTYNEYYDDLYVDHDTAHMHSFVYTHVSGGAGPPPLRTWQFMDGSGKVAREFVMTGDQSSAEAFVTRDTEYDVMGRPYRTSNPYYTPEGSNSPQDPANLWTVAEYDKLGRAKKVFMPNNNGVAETIYAGNVTTTIDAAGKRRRQMMDALGRLVRSDEPDATGNLDNGQGNPVQSTFYFYDALDNLIKTTQGDQNRYFRYDSLSRMTHERQVEQDAPHAFTDPLTNNNAWSSRRTYNSFGLVAEAWDARNIKTTPIYDGLNRIKTITFSDGTPTVTYNYDQVRTGYQNKGRLTEMKTAAVGTTVPETAEEYDYTILGQIAQQRQRVGTTTYTIGYTYNALGSLATETYPSGRVVTNNYDAYGRLSKVSDAARTFASGIKYAAHGGLAAEGWAGTQTAPAMQHTIGYNRRNQPTEIKLTAGGVERQRYEVRYGVINFDTGLIDVTKNNGQVSRVEGYIEGVKKWQQRYEYDSSARLGRASEYNGDTGAQVWASAYTYDRYGNRFQSGAGNTGLGYTTVTPANISTTTNRFTSQASYDPAGNITQDTRFGNGELYSYDANGRMTSAWQTTGLGSSVYDAVGLRVRTSESGTGTETRLLYDIDGRVIAEYRAGVLDREYIYRGGGLLATWNAQEGVRYVLHDWQGSPRVVTGETGSVAARHDYTPFGGEMPVIGTRTVAQGYNQTDRTRTGFALTERDDATSLRHTTWRKLATGAGRWTSPDPYLGSMNTADPQSFNRYAYVQNDPVNLVDPTGLDDDYINALWLLFGGHHWEVYVTADAGPDLSSLYSLMYGGISQPLIQPVMSPVETTPLDPAPEPQDKPQLERNLSHDTQNYDRWHRHFAACAKAKGIRIAVDGALFMAGQPLMPKRFTTSATSAGKGASEGTSILSRALGNGPKIGRVWAPTLNNLRAKTTHLGRAVSRWTPWAAAVDLGVNFAGVVNCANERYGKDDK
jgi:RHS repeat-associated protein